MTKINGVAVKIRTYIHVHALAYVYIYIKKAIFKACLLLIIFSSELCLS